MILQIEDCVDCLKTLYPQYAYEFELDHSSGHNSERIDGLSITAMNLGWGGKQRRMRNSILTKEDLGEFKDDYRLTVGSE